MKVRLKFYDERLTVCDYMRTVGARKMINIDEIQIKQK